MNPLLEQFLSEARDFLQGIGEKLMQLEQAPGDSGLMNELFRLVHTLKGNSGLFEFPEMTRVLHAGEDLMDAVKDGRVGYAQDLADQLLDAMDFVGLLCDEIESAGRIDASRAADSVRLAEALRALIVSHAAADVVASEDNAPSPPPPTAEGAPPSLADIPEAIRVEAFRRAQDGDPLHWLVYTPVAECFYQGDDPFFQARQTPDLLWGDIVAPEPWPKLAELDAYRCVLGFRLLTAAPREVLDEYYRYVPDQVRISAVAPLLLATPQGIPNGGPVYSEEDAVAFEAILVAQRRILLLDDHPVWQTGRLKAVAGVLVNCFKATGDPEAAGEIEAALAQSLATGDGVPLLAWLDARHGDMQPSAAQMGQAPVSTGLAAISPDGTTTAKGVTSVMAAAPAAGDETTKFGRRAEDQPGTKSLKVDQVKIDHLMNLIGEMVVSKNALPYLAHRAENQYGVRELSREIKAQYAVINRIAEEMQDAIMQVRMMPVSFVFQRFPRLVRDTSRKLGKEVNLVLEGEETEADKNIIEALADPLIHIIRNSLDHGLETPDVRRACGKPTVATLTIRAAQEADRVVIEIIDDGKGIDPGVIKRKAYEKGVINEATLERISDQEAINLVFAAGLSTAEVVSDLSGRGVGMDVVRTAVEKIHGDILLESEVGKGTRLRISLPLSMAVTKVMIIESNQQIFGVPMDHVVETVRVPRGDIFAIKHCQATMLRGRIVPFKALNVLLGLPAEPKANADDELAVLVVRVGGETVGLLVDNFREAVDIIQKPLSGVLSSLAAYSGSALMGDGSVLMVLNVKEIV